jgi:hypothetical protein
VTDTASELDTTLFVNEDYDALLEDVFDFAREVFALASIVIDIVDEGEAILYTAAVVYE